ncbi:MAG: hypothetical protein GYB67_00135 [Chloroflexi bacterium]|nr:hypothetical protein [Chloroflexota bacterium]
MRNLLILITVLVILPLTASGTARAHGVIIEHRIDPATGAITLSAAFDTGEVMSAAQVAVFAPNDLATPWLTGVCDENGVFTFTPDYTIEGSWDIQVRKAGHGGLINVQLDESMAPVAGPSEPVADAAAAQSAESLPSTLTSDAAQIRIAGSAQIVIEGDLLITVDEASLGQIGTTTAAAAVTPTTPPAAISGGFTTQQIALMSVSIIWGFVGTAAFFTSRRQIRRLRSQAGGTNANKPVTESSAGDA